MTLTLEDCLQLGDSGSAYIHGVSAVALLEMLRSGSVTSVERRLDGSNRWYLVAKVEAIADCDYPIEVHLFSTHEEVSDAEADA